METPKLFDDNQNIVASICELYQRNEKSLEEDVKKLKLWMETQPHLPEILDDRSIQNFIILNKFCIENAKRSIDMYYTIKSRFPELYENVNPKCVIMKEVTEIESWVILPKRTKEKCRVFFYKLRNENLTGLDPQNAFGFMINLLELRLKEDVMFGDIFISDMKGLPLSYLTKLTPMFFAKIIAVYEKVYSIPLKGVYILNSPPFIASILNILKSFLKPKILQRIHIVKDTSSLLELFPKEIIPRDYGGDEQSIEELRELLLSKLDQFQDRFDLLDKLRVDESLRPEKLEDDEILGFYGNFKQLNVD